MISIRDSAGRFIKGVNNGPYKKSSYHCLCKTCNKLFYASPSRIRIGKGKYCSKECASNLLFKKGEYPWNKNKKLPELSMANSARWTGSEIKYRPLHLWIQYNLGKPNKCTSCGKIGYRQAMHWANTDHKYRRVLCDWIRLCAKCHSNYDLLKGLRVRK